MIKRNRSKPAVTSRRRAFMRAALCAACGFALCLPAVRPAFAAEEEAPEFAIHDFSLWGFDPTLEQANQVQHFPSTLPGVVDTHRSRSNAEGKITPFSLLTFHGAKIENLEIDLRVQTGRFVSHWPPGESKSGRVRWLDVVASHDAAKEGRFAAVDARHWFNTARQLDSLYLRSGARNERFILYDAELKLSQPLQIAGGPERYRLSSLSKTPMYDVLVVAPAGDTCRVGWLDELPAAKPQPVKPGGAKPAAKPGQAKPAEAKPEAAKPAVAAAANNQPPLVAAPQPVEKKAATPQPGGQGPAVAAAPELVGEPVEMEMSAPLAADAEALKAVRQKLADSLQQQGFTDKEVQLIMDRAAPAIFGAKELLVVCRLPASAIEERLPLVTYPAAQKTIRVAWVCSRNVDPKIKDEVKQLVAQLAAADYAEREAAEKRLLELGRLAVPVLKEALKSSDPEVQFRAERLLLAQGEKISG